MSKVQSLYKKFGPTAIVILLIVILKSTFSLYVIGSFSMEPTFSQGDYILVSDFHYNFFEPKKGDIVLFEPVEGVFEIAPWTHRVIATSGDKVRVEDGVISVNSQEVMFPQIISKDIEVEIVEGEVFQKGDSSNSTHGIISQEHILGKIVFIF